MELYENIYKKDDTFSFGQNWSEFLDKITDEKIEMAKKSITDFLGVENLKGKTFIDVGTGSGLFSLSAILLGAEKVVSVDADEYSVECAKVLRKKYNISEDKWNTHIASALDTEKMKTFGTYDVVYSWGVLHHTGDMNKALENVTHLVNDDGMLYIAIYNNFQGFPIKSPQWRVIKKFYSNGGKVRKKIMEYIYYTYFFVGSLIYRKNPMKTIKNYDKIGLRGMDFYSDAKDWLGGYPYEYASVKYICDFYEKFDYKLINCTENKGNGCSEFLFQKK